MTAQPWTVPILDAVYAAAYRVAETKGDGATGPVDEVAQAVLEAVREHVTPTATLRELSDGWDDESELCFPEKYTNELREVIDRG